MPEDNFTILNFSLLIMLIAIAAATIFSRNLLIAVIFLMIFSLIMALEYLVLGAPDVAITEASIGACISTLILLGALIVTGEKESKSKHPILPMVVILATGAALIYATSGLPLFGNADSITNKYIAPYYIENSESQTGVPNVVTSVLASYRGFDTLFETYVIFTAGISVYLLLGGRKKIRRNKNL